MGRDAHRIGVRHPRTGRGGGNDALPVPGHLERILLHVSAAPLALLQPGLGDDPLSAGHRPQKLGAADLGFRVLLHRPADHVGHRRGVLGLHFPTEAVVCIRRGRGR